MLYCITSVYIEFTIAFIVDGQSIAKHVSAMKRKAIHSSMPRPFMKNSDRKGCVNMHLFL
jgi:hypothetical protein